MLHEQAPGIGGLSGRRPITPLIAARRSSEYQTPSHKAPPVVA
jgi:hypothetical protein